MDEAALSRFQGELLSILSSSADTEEARARLERAESSALRTFAAEVDEAMLATAVALAHRWARADRGEEGT